MVLHIFGNQNFGSQSEAGIRKAICELKNLQELILPTFHVSDGFITGISKNHMGASKTMLMTGVKHMV